MTLIMAVFAVYYLGKKMLKNKEYYREKGISKNVEYELTSVRNKGTSGEYQRPTDLIREMGEEDALNNSSTQIHGIGEPKGYGF